MRVAVLTAYTSDYEIGCDICAPVNRKYAERHGYAFVERIHPPWQRELDSRHPSWNKVHLLCELLDGLIQRREGLPVPLDTTHLLWVDADAVVVWHDKRVEDLWARHCSEHCQLLIGEDVTPCCLVNAGVFCVRVSDWSAALWRDVLAGESATKFRTLPYYEQSVLLRQLEKRGEGLNLQACPFHSYTGGHAAPKHFPHVVVLPRNAINTNRIDVPATAGGRLVADCGCEFIFHAAGHPILRCAGGGDGDAHGDAALWKPSKPTALRAVLHHAGLGPPPDESGR
jgi:hypothetical protein